MARTGNIFPTVGANVDRAGSTAWTNPGNVVSDNTTDATVVVPSDYLVTSSYGFTIPTDATIHGVIVRVEASESGTGSSNYVPQLHSDTTPTLIGAAKGAVTVNGTTKVISSNGAINDLWSATLTPTVVNAAGFGVSIWSTDTINTLAVDFITIEIEFSQPAAFVPVRALRRRNKTNRRARFALLNPQENGIQSEPASDDRALEGGFVTVVLRSRRALSAGWIAALASQPQAPAVPAIAAWAIAQAPRRRQTARRLLIADPTPIERYTPPAIAWSDPPKVIGVEFRRTLQQQAPQITFPPTTGPPPVEYFPAWATQQRPPTFQDRRALRVTESPVYPEPPKPEPNLCARIATGFHKRKGTKRRPLTVELAQFTATPAEEISDDRALEAAFVTRKIRSRKALRETPLVITAAAPPETTPAVYPSFVPTGFNRRHETERTLRQALPPPVWPATPAIGGQPITAVTGIKVRRRKHRQGLFMSGGGVVEARVQPQFPSYATPHPKKRKSTERRLLRLGHPPATPQTPAVPAQPVSAWRAPKQHWIERARKLQPAAPQLTHPPTPAVGAQPESAFRASVANRIERRRRLLPQAEQITYPATPAAPVQPLPAWAAPPTFHVERRRTLRVPLPLNTYPATPGQPQSAWRAVAANRIEHRRTLRTVAHAPSYQPTPAPPQPVTALVLGGFHRRHGWRVLLEPLELDSRPETPPPAPVTRKGRHVKAGAQGRRGQASVDRIVRAKRRNRTLDAE